MDIATFQIIGLKRIECDKKNPTMTWMGGNYICSPSNADSETDTIIWGGEERTADMVIKVRIALFTNGIYPQSPQPLTFNGKQFKIATVDANIFKTFLRLRLMAYTMS